MTRTPPKFLGKKLFTHEPQPSHHINPNNLSKIGYLAWLAQFSVINSIGILIFYFMVLAACQHRISPPLN